MRCAPCSRTGRASSGMLDFEAALAQAEAVVGVIPQGAADAIAGAATPAGSTPRRWRRPPQTAGNLAIPLVAALTRNVAATDPVARGYVHWGATSQDVDRHRARAAAARRAGADRRRRRAARRRARDARRAAMRRRCCPGAPGCSRRSRSRWASSSPASSARWTGTATRLAELRRRALVLQFGGAVGTLASLGERGIAVSDGAGRAARAAVCPTCRGTRSATASAKSRRCWACWRPRSASSRATSRCSRRPRSREVFEPAAPGRGGSSTMPQKRNPVGASMAIAAAVRVPGLVATMLAAAAQEHERGLGNWPAEWETLPEIVLLVAGALAAMADVAPGLDVDADADAREPRARRRARSSPRPCRWRWRTRWAATARTRWSPTPAGARRARACHLRDVLRADPRGHLGARRCNARPRCSIRANYLGESRRYIERALAAHPA